MASTQGEHPTLATPSRAGRARRGLEVTATVAIWMALGFLFHLSVIGYQLTGVVLVVAFQLLLRRRPLRELWVREGPPFRLDAAGWSIAVLLAAWPLFHAVQDLRAGDSATNLAAHLAAAAGAIPAAYALRSFRRNTLRPLLLCLAIPGALGIAMMIAGGAIAGNIVHRSLGERLAIGIDSLLLYVPLVFVFEEVSFRGAFDSHLQQPGEPGEWLSAIWVSVLWGLWHVPVTRAMAPLPRLIVNNVFVCCVIGVPFSFFWRRSGNLFVTGWTHAVVDAVRNSFLVLLFR